MENHLHGEALNTHAELATLRMLVESLIASSSDRLQHDTSRAFQTQCEQQQAELLGSAARDELLDATERAIDLQWNRLAAFGVERPA